VFVYGASLLAFIFSLSTFAIPLPARPRDPAHPSSAFYPYSVESTSVSFENRQITIYFPKAKPGLPPPVGKFPVVVFGHGHWVPLLAYEDTFIHLAGKGIATIFVSYDTSPWDEDYERMARDYVRQVDFVLRKYALSLDNQKVIFSGHSNGSFVALMAAGLPAQEQIFVPQSLVLFAVADAKPAYLARVNPRTVVSIIVGEDDVELAELAPKIYAGLSVSRKQLILAKSYHMTDPPVSADHGFVRTLDWTGHRLTPLHYFGSWKYLVGAAQDLLAGGPVKNPYVYGNQTASTGLPGFLFDIKKNW
jgi:pimeloyl-ACP methyl ester carboxylesterase